MHFFMAKCRNVALTPICLIKTLCDKSIGVDTKSIDMFSEVTIVD